MNRMIICDDETIIRNGLKNLIESSDCKIKVEAVASNGNEALQLLLEHEPSIALMDINMPGITGLDIIEKCKEKKLKTKFIIISGYDDFQYAKRACHLQAIDYLLKPIDKNELLTILKSTLQQIKEEQLTQHILVKDTDSLGKQILAFIQDHFTEYDFSLTTLASHFNMSQSYITRLIKQESQRSFSELLIQLRIEEAIKLLLQNPTMKLIEISEKCGFSSQHYFSRVFKEKTGFPPADYRKNFFNQNK